MIASILELSPRTLAGASAPSLAASLGRIPVVEAMFARGLDANATDKRGNTLLQITLASLWRDAAVPGLLTAVEKPESLIARDVPRTLMQLLLDRGADANVRNASGKTPFAVVTDSIKPIPPYKPMKTALIHVGKARIGDNGLAPLDSSATADHDVLVTRNQYLSGIQALLSRYTKS